MKDYKIGPEPKKSKPPAYKPNQIDRDTKAHKIKPVYKEEWKDLGYKDKGVGKEG
jgi:hypothetical protein